MGLNKLRIGLARLFVNTLGQTSDGIRLCTQYGLISGKVIDYIYRNQPSGRGIIGREIDRIFISNIGWDGIRTRKDNLQVMLGTAINLCIESFGKADILDVAAGPAKYIIDELANHKNKEVQAVCRDLDVRWLQEGAKNAKAIGVNNIRFEAGDAFSRASFKTLDSEKNIIVSSGFYDWITDDSLIKESMKIIHENLTAGGYFIFSNQSGHPDMELVSGVFNDFNAQPLRMTTRSADAINAWAQETGFEILETQSDKHGFYSVTLAKKP